MSYLALHASPFNENEIESGMKRMNTNNDDEIEQKRQGRPNNKTLKKRPAAHVEKMMNMVQQNNNGNNVGPNYSGLGYGDLESDLLGNFMPPPPPIIQQKNMQQQQAQAQNNDNDNDNDNGPAQSNRNISLVQGNSQIQGYGQAQAQGYGQAQQGITGYPRAQAQQAQAQQAPKEDTSITKEAFHNMPNTAANDYYKQYVPYYNQMSQHNTGGNQNHLIEKLNYMIELLEEQKNEQTGHIMEELILYAFLGIFIIFIIDSFARAGKYTR